MLQGTDKDSSFKRGRVGCPPISVVVSLLLVCLILGAGVYVMFFYLK